MNKIFKSLVLFPVSFLLSACSPADAGSIEADDLARDKLQSTEKVVRFLELKAGMRVLDVFAGGGYYSEKAANEVGASGRVYAWNNAFFLKLSKKERRARRLADRFSQVEELNGEVQDLEWPTELDRVVIATVFHDLWVPRIVGEGYNAVDPVLSGLFAALKPGGKVLVIDHNAPESAKARFAADLHRIEEDYLEKLFTDAGFVLEGKLNDLRRDGDNFEVSIFNKAVKGNTDRFVHLYVKPAD